MRYGASPSEWAHFSSILGLIADLLPVVSNPTAKISKASKMSGVGKTPSLFNAGGFAVGFTDWTRHYTTSAEIDKWAKIGDLGICLQTREVRALDIDVEDHDESVRIGKAFQEALERTTPARTRPNSSKQLLVFRLPGEYYKRKFKTKHGIVEFLATGQQFIAVGTHTSGVRYEWHEGLPSEIPEVSPEQFERAWAHIVAEFGVEEATESSAPSKAAKLAELHQTDPVSTKLQERGLVLGVTREGRLDITCPFADGHSTESSESSTSYYPPNTGGYSRGHFHCLHASCAHRTDQDFEEAIGITSADDFEDISDQPPPSDMVDIETKPDSSRFKFVQAAEFSNSKPPSWIIKHVLPQAELAVMYGASGSGKSFMALDMVGAIARGIPWHGHTVKQGRVAYIAAEGATGCKNRMRAYAQANGIPLGQIDLFFLPDTPGMLDKKDVIDLIAALKLILPMVVVVDTLAQVLSGGDENSGADMGLLLKACRAIHKHTGALVVLIHHSGKNAAAGARGHSSLKAAADVEFEVLRVEDDRVLSLTKMKDGDDQGDFGFKLKQVPIGVDEDNEVVTSCVVEFTDATRKSVANYAGPAERTVLDLVLQMHNEDRQWPWGEDLKRRVKSDLPTIGRNLKRTLDNLMEKGLLEKDDADRFSIPVPENLV